MDDSVWAAFPKSPNVEDRRPDPYEYKPEDLGSPDITELLHSLGIFPPMSPAAQALGMGEIAKDNRDPITQFLQDGKIKR